MSDKQFQPSPLKISPQQDIKIPFQKLESNQKQQQPQHKIEGITIFCSICKDYIAHSVTTICEHTFCELCLTEYLLYLDQCPDCMLKIRKQRLSNNILLDNLIMDYINKFEPQDLQDYKGRMDEYKQFKKNKTLGELQVGSKVDIRDLQYVWCTGKVIRIVTKYQSRRIKFVLVKYDRSLKKEEVEEGSQRLAPKGFFTGREDVPKYQRGRVVIKNKQENITYVLPKGSQEEYESQEVAE